MSEDRQLSDDLQETSGNIDKARRDINHFQKHNPFKKKRQGNKTDGQGPDVSGNKTGKKNTDGTNHKTVDGANASAKGSPTAQANGGAGTAATGGAEAKESSHFSSCG